MSEVMDQPIYGLPEITEYSGTDHIIIETENGTKIITVDDLMDSLNTGLYNALYNNLYEGRNLEEVFEHEIADYNNAWDWIQDRIETGYLSDLRNRDYIPLILSGTIDGTTISETHKMQLNINTYKGTTDQTALGDMIDFISRDCCSPTVQWNTTNNNNGNEENACPYMVSNIHDWLENSLLPCVPSEAAEHIVTKRALLEERYSASGTLTESTSWSWNDMGKLWIPSEVEIFGALFRSGEYAQGQGVQYPVYAGGWETKLGHNVLTGSRCHWWESSVRPGNSTHACYVNSNGYPSGASASYSVRVPLCFRFTA